MRSALTVKSGPVTLNLCGDIAEERQKLPRNFVTMARVKIAYIEGSTFRE